MMTNLFFLTMQECQFGWGGGLLKSNGGVQKVIYYFYIIA